MHCEKKLEEYITDDSDGHWDRMCRVTSEELLHLTL